MNRFTIAVIVILLLALATVSWYYNRELKKINVDKIEILQQDMLKIQYEQKQVLDVDSIVSILEGIAFDQVDSLANRYDGELKTLKNYYRYELKKSDQRLNARLDSINLLIPTLPEL